MGNRKRTIEEEPIPISEEKENQDKEADTTSENSSQNMPSDKSPKEDFPVVGIGASAGGLASFEAFFSAMPTGTKPEMAFIVVQHLDPTHKSILTEIIGRYTEMPVYEAENRMPIKPNSIYVIPPNYYIALEDDMLLLLEPTEPRGYRMPIDVFFNSLARVKQDKAIGIIFSGTGSDGTKGMRAIKGEGGIVMVQTPDQVSMIICRSARFLPGLLIMFLNPQICLPSLFPMLRMLLKKFIT